MRIADFASRIASGHRHTIFTRWLLLSAQLERRAIFILFFLFVRIPDFFEAVLTDGVFNQAGFVFGDFRVYARSDQLPPLSITRNPPLRSALVAWLMLALE